MQPWNYYKDSHKALSAIAAPYYDELYAESNFATGIYMHYEEEALARCIDGLDERDIAVVLGSGTGRECFILAEFFNKVYGFDFSPEMVAVAERKKKQFGKTNVFFQELDVEIEPLPFEQNSVNMVNSTFGMGSLVRNPPLLVENIYKILKPKGRCIISFYNSQAFIAQIKLRWQPAITSKLNHAEELLEVDFNGDKFKVPVVPYSVSQVNTLLSKHFNILEISTFPALSSLLPIEFFENEQLKKLCLEADKLISKNLDLAGGPFILAICEKATD